MANLEYRSFEGIPNIEVLSWLTEVNQKVFGLNETQEQLSHLFKQQTGILICLVFQEEQPVGFKVGFKDNSRPLTFESWRGGVLKSSRRQGIALELMRLQHEWCHQHHIKVITTTTDGDNQAMLIVNLRSGFKIVGSFVNHRGKLKVLQEKRLT